jgi:inosine/xanthosine triphosphate pyrophosphatase family protein
MDIVLATNDLIELKQIKALFREPEKEKEPRFRVLSLHEAGIKGEPIENGMRLEQITIGKAFYAHEQAPDLWALSIQMGWRIGGPKGLLDLEGARWMTGKQSAINEARRNLLRQMLKLSDRSMLFETCIVVVAPRPKRKPYWITSKVRGEILKQPRVRKHPGLPYDSLFVPNTSPEKLTWAEMSIKEGPSLLYRGQAYSDLIKFLSGRC